MMPLGNFRESSGCIKEALLLGKGLKIEGNLVHIQVKLFCFRFLMGELIFSLPSSLSKGRKIKNENKYAFQIIF